jgi:hypothetical protein
LDLAQLEAFHRAGVLIPLYIASAPMVRMGLSDGRGDRRLQDLRTNHQLDDPRVVGYRAWGLFRRRTTSGHEATRTWWYSCYQLLALPEVERLRQFLRPRPSARELHHHALRLPPWYPRPAGESQDLGLVGLLTRLEPVYLPYVVRRLSLGLAPEGTEAWYQDYETFRRGFEPARVLLELGLRPDELLAIGERLIHSANFLDPNRAWIDLLRNMEPSRWTEITGPGLMAIDFRVAAELILVCYEDLAASNQAPPLPELPLMVAHPLKDRLEREPEKLDPTLTHYGLSPHPALVIAAEGVSDEYILRKTLELLRVRPGRAFIDIAATGGIDKNFDTLVRHLAPEPDQELDDLVIIGRPITRVLRIVDAEGRMGTAGQRETERQRLIGQIRGAWALKGGPELEPAELDGVVEVLTWGTMPMEFANFHDGELATAISRLSRDRTRLSAATLRKIRVGSRPGPGLGDLLESRGLAKRKLDLAVELWPSLERRIERLLALKRESEVPAVQVVHRAMELAMAGPRGPVGLRKRRSLGQG